MTDMSLKPKNIKVNAFTFNELTITLEFDLIEFLSALKDFKEHCSKVKELLNELKELNSRKVEIVKNYISIERDEVKHVSLEDDYIKVMTIKGIEIKLPKNTQSDLCKELSDLLDKQCRIKAKLIELLVNIEKKLKKLINENKLNISILE